MTPVLVEPHPQLELGAFLATFPLPLGQFDSKSLLIRGIAPGFAAPMERSEEVRAVSRDLLRHGGYKPTGRGKPASEYLVRAVEQGKLGEINAVVDACNLVSYHSGLPISVVDADRAQPPWRVAVAESGSSYVFNRAGQIIDIGGLLCLFDKGGPCANAVKDSQRTKTSEETTRTLCLIWGSRSLSEQTAAASTWYRELLEELGATTAAVELTAP